MSIKTVLRMGDLRLYRVADLVTDFHADFLKGIIADMYDTVISLHGAGIAAPQLGYHHRVVLFGVPTPRYPDVGMIPETVLINPEISVLTDETEGCWEGCLSVPGLRGFVERPTHILYRGYDQEGKPIEREAKGFHARVVQHEVDHLDGILFPARVKDLRLLAFEEEPGFQALKQRVQAGERI